MKNLKKGQMEIDGKRLFAIVVDDDSKNKDNAKRERHKNYIDIYCTGSG